MPFRSHIYHPGKPGTWPNGEPKSVREAYDELLAEQAKDQEQNSESSPINDNHKRSS